jgi:hypothetical protein
MLNTFMTGKSIVDSVDINSSIKNEVIPGCSSAVEIEQ